MASKYIGAIDQGTTSSRAVLLMSPLTSILTGRSGWRGRLSSLHMVMAHDDSVTAVAFSPDGRTVLTGSRGRTAALWGGP